MSCAEVQSYFNSFGVGAGSFYLYGGCVWLLGLSAAEINVFIIFTTGSGYSLPNWSLTMGPSAPIRAHFARMRWAPEYPAHSPRMRAMAASGDRVDFSGFPEDPSRPAIGQRRSLRNSATFPLFRQIWRVKWGWMACDVENVESRLRRQGHLSTILDISVGKFAKISTCTPVADQVDLRALFGIGYGIRKAEITSLLIKGCIVTSP